MSVISDLKKKYVGKHNSLLNFDRLSINNSKYQYNTLTDRKRRRYLKEKKNITPKRVDESEIRRTINQLISHYKSPYDLCINALIQFPSFRNKEIINLIKPYLKDLIGLMDIVSKEKNEELSDKTLSQIAMNLQYKKINKDKFICKFGEKGNNFYIILKGKVVFLVPKIIKCYLNESEYLSHLIKLKNNGENELLRNIMSINRQYYDLGDDFDYFIRELMEDYNNNNKKNSAFITPEIYNILKNMIDEQENKKINDDNENKSQENNDNELLNINDYIERSKVKDMNLNSKDRKRVNIFMYHITNYYEDGQIFGTVALESKYGKRSATAISLEDCELGLLTKEQYNSSLELIHQKSLDVLFNLINSYNILGLAPKKAFDNRFCHMFKCVRFKRGAKLMEENKIIKSVIVFRDGQFVITLNKNILELNELMAKLYKIRGKMMGLNENVIKKELSSNCYNKDYIMNQNFILPETMKLYEKKHNLTISIVNDKLVIGLMDTVDPETHLPLFNCTCTSQTCDGYEITNNSLNLVNKEYACNNNNNQISLINVEYFLKRLQLHMKEIESKIEKYTKNLKYATQMKKNINNINKSEDGETTIIENKKNEDENNYEIRRNSFEIKKKNNNEISLVQILGNSFKKDYTKLKKKRFNTIDKNNNDSRMNINSDNKRYENMKTINQEIIIDNKENNYSFFFKIKNSIKHKEHLLKMAQGRSQKFMEIKKAEMRSLNMARNKRYQKNKYIDISAIFNQNYSSSKGKRDSAKKKDIILDNIINTINKNSKYERILSSYISKNNNDNYIKEKEKDGKLELKKEGNENKEKFEEDKNDTLEIKIKKLNNLPNEEKLEIIPNKKLQINTILKNKEIKYPLIKSNIRNLIYNVNESRNNIITLEGFNSLGNQDLSISKSKRKKDKKNNKIINNNYRKSKKNSQINKNRNNSTSVKNNFKIKAEIFNNNLPSIMPYYNKEKVHFVDPLVLDKFNEHYINNKLKTLEK